MCVHLCVGVSEGVRECVCECVFIYIYIYIHERETPYHAPACFSFSVCLCVCVYAFRPLARSCLPVSLSEESAGVTLMLCDDGASPDIPFPPPSFPQAPRPPYSSEPHSSCSARSSAACSRPVHKKKPPPSECCGFSNTFIWLLHTCDFGHCYLHNVHIISPFRDR